MKGTMSKNVLTIAVLLVLIINFSALATPPVWQALGGDHRFLIDNTNYTAYPGRVTSYGNTLFLLPASSATSASFYQQRYFTDDGVIGGVLFNLTSDITLGYHSLALLVSAIFKQRCRNLLIHNMLTLV